MISDAQKLDKIYLFDKKKELNAVFTDEGGALVIWLESKI
jgi:hypothetical protein